MHITQLPKLYLTSGLIGLGCSLGFGIFKGPALGTVLNKGQLPEKPVLQIKRLRLGREAASSGPKVLSPHKPPVCGPAGATPLASRPPTLWGRGSHRCAPPLGSPRLVLSRSCPCPLPSASHFQDGRGWSRPGKGAPGGSTRGL